MVLNLHAALEQRGLGPEALGVIDNLLAHESAVPAEVPSLVRELLARPAAAADAAALFARSVPPALAGFAAHRSSGESFEQALAGYVARVAEAQTLLRSATPAIDGAALSRQLRAGGLPADALSGLKVDAVRLAEANRLFIEATRDFTAALRIARIPEAARFATRIGSVSIGSRGDDVHGPDAALIIDPGGNDVYVRAPANDRVALVFDLAGNDRYSGSDLAVRALAALVDFGGDDRYAMQGPGLGAAVAGASLLVDMAGNDVYEAHIFGLGAAAHGIGALIDEEGDEQYRVHAWGQGFALAGGLGLLWDGRGDDRYPADGLADPFDRGGALSGAQGATFGYRTALAGGVGILRDSGGNDRYEAQMFAQGTGYYYGLGLLWDEAGNETYRAVRYAQGNGVHQAVGVLRDASGNDHYQLSFGVGQGMGLDLAVGVLVDGAGDDRYAAGVLAQGTATANGVGILEDLVGRDRYESGADARAWGHAEWSRGLPSLGFLFHHASAVFIRNGETASPPGKREVVHEPEAQVQCPADLGLERRLTHAFAQAMAQLRRDDFDQVLAYAGAVYCAMRAADLSLEAGRLLGEALPPQLAIAIARALRERPPPAEQLKEVRAALSGHPSCAVRAVALEIWPEPAAAQAALASSCWRLQAAGRRIRGQTPN
jgi:hypothetical protein